MPKTKVPILVALPLLFALTAMAQRRPPIHWVSGGETLAVEMGKTLDFEAAFYSDIRIPNADWWLSSSLHPLFGGALEYAGFLGEIEPDRIYRIRVRINIPPTLKSDKYTGNLHVFNRKGGQPFATVPEVLPVTIYVMEPVD